MALMAVMALVALLGAGGLGGPASAAGGLRVAVPAGFFPSERDFPGSNKPMWDRLAAAGGAVGLVAVVNLPAPSTDYVDFVARQQRAGQRVVVTMPASGFTAQLATLRGWLRVDGILLADASPDCANVSPAEVAAARATGMLVVADLTGPPQSCWKPLADVVRISATWNSSSVPTRPAWWTAGDSPALWYQLLSVPQAPSPPWPTAPGPRVRPTCSPRRSPR